MRPAQTQLHRPYWVYLIRRGDGALYAGIALDVQARLRQHERGEGSKALRGRGPLALALQRRVGPLGLALRVEAALKRLPKAKKEELVASPQAFARWLQARRRAATRAVEPAPRAKGPAVPTKAARRRAKAPALGGGASG